MAYEMSAVTGPFVTKPTCAIGVGPGALAEAAENTGVAQALPGFTLYIFQVRLGCARRACLHFANEPLQRALEQAQLLLLHAR